MVQPMTCCEQMLRTVARCTFPSQAVGCLLKRRSATLISVRFGRTEVMESCGQCELSRAAEPMLWVLRRDLIGRVCLARQQLVAERRTVRIRIKSSACQMSLV